MRVLKVVATAAMAGFLLQSCTTDTKFDGAVGSVIESIENKCKYLPTVLSIGAILNIPGAPQGEKLVQQICAAVEKAKAQKAETETKAGNQQFLSRDGTFPAGVKLEFEYRGKLVSGKTTK